MLAPEYLQGLPDAILELYTQAERRILADMARRLVAYDYWVPAVEHQRQVLEAAGRAQEEILDTLSTVSGKSTSELRRMMQEAGTMALEADAAEYAAAGLSVPDFQQSDTLRKILNAGYRSTLGTMQNLTKTTARTASRQLEQALDQIWLEVHAGGVDLNSALRGAIQELSTKGVQSIRYPSGRCDSLEVAVRRAAVTGINQTALQLQDQLAEEVRCDLVETTAHAGARPEHALWQGRIFSRSGKSDKYPSLREGTGYGTGAGLGGWNCRHSFHPYIEGGPRAYTDKQLQDLNAPKYEYDGKKLTEYEATQLQRYNERQIRRWERECVALDAAGLDASEAESKLTAWQNQQEDFLLQTGLNRQFDRERIVGQVFTKSQKSGKIQLVTFDDKQFGKKVGKHAADFGLSASTPEDRARMKAAISDIVNYADERVRGDWRGQEQPVLFYIKGQDVVVTKENGEFVTVLKGGVENARVKKARGQ